MSDLIEFLRARLDEDEQLAKTASPGPWHENAENDEVMAVDDITVAEGFALSGNQLRSTVSHIVRNDPARVLREIQAKRRIIEEHANREVASLDRRTWGQTFVVCRRCREGERQIVAPCPTLRLLALPYSDHSDYQEEWRP